MFTPIDRNEDASAGAEEALSAEVGIQNASMELLLSIKPGKSDIYCEECKQEIPAARREFIPNCRFCVNCQSGTIDSRRISRSYLSKEEVSLETEEDEEEKEKARPKISAKPFALPSKV